MCFFTSKTLIYFYGYSVLLCCLVIFIPNQPSFVQGMNCSVILDDSDKWVEANEQCIKTNKIDETKLEDVSLNVTLEEFEVDDNCYIQCIYSKVGILTPDGMLDQNQTVNIFKGNMTAEMLEKTVSIWDTCIDEADKVGSIKSLNPCKILSLHDFCFNKMVVENGILEEEC